MSLLVEVSVNERQDYSDYFQRGGSLIASKDFVLLEAGANRLQEWIQDILVEEFGVGTE